jgi:hypothetical protein
LHPANKKVGDRLSSDFRALLDSKVYRFSVLTINLQSQNVKINSSDERCVDRFHGRFTFAYIDND